MKTFILSLSVALLFALASCQKDNNMKPSPSPTIRVADDSSAQDAQTPHLKSSSSILNASNANQIPSQFFKVGSLYKLNFNFITQPDPYSCSWTSYVTAIGAIARGNGYSYSSSSSKIYSVKSQCMGLASQDQDNAGLITTLQNCANIYDSKYVYARFVHKYNNSSDRFNAVKEMLNHINTYHTPFLVVSTFYKSNGTKVGHYLVVLSIDWKQGGTGSTVYYTDCGYASNGWNLDNNLSSMNFTTFLDRMVDAPINYNILFFQPN